MNTTREELGTENLGSESPGTPSWGAYRRSLNRACVALAVVLAVTGASTHSFADSAARLGFSAVMPAAIWQRQVVFFVSLAPVLVGAFALWRLGRDLLELPPRAYFSRDLERAARRFAVTVASSSLLGFAAVMISSLTLSVGNEAQQHVVVSLTLEQVLSLVVALVAWGASHGIAQGARLEEENQAFI